MFTGIVEKTSKVMSAEIRGVCRYIRIRRPRGWKLSSGQSVSIDGICSTVVSFGRNSFDVEYIPKTLSKTTAGEFTRDKSVNLERSLTFGDPVDGHIVYGHVDGRGRITALTEMRSTCEIVITVKPGVARAISLHGAVAVNGVSLTVARKRGVSFTVALIPYTLKYSNLRHLGVDDTVNIETDKTLYYLRGNKNATVLRNAAKRIRKKS